MSTPGLMSLSKYFCLACLAPSSQRKPVATPYRRPHPTIFFCQAVHVTRSPCTRKTVAFWARIDSCRLQVIELLVYFFRAPFCSLKECLDSNEAKLTAHFCCIRSFLFLGDQVRAHCRLFHNAHAAVHEPLQIFCLAFVSRPVHSANLLKPLTGGCTSPFFFGRSFLSLGYLAQAKYLRFGLALTLCCFNSFNYRPPNSISSNGTLAIACTTIRYLKRKALL